MPFKVGDKVKVIPEKYPDNAIEFLSILGEVETYVNGFNIVKGITAKHIASQEIGVIKLFTDDELEKVEDDANPPTE